MKKILSLSIILVFAFSAFTFARRVTYRTAKKNRGRIFVKKCYKEARRRHKRVSKKRIRRSLTTYNRNATRYKRVKRRSTKRKYKRRIRSNYRTLSRYCPRTARRMLRR